MLRLRIDLKNWDNLWSLRGEGEKCLTEGYKSSNPFHCVGQAEVIFLLPKLVAGAA